MRRVQSLLPAVFLILLPGVAHADAILINGSFELGPPVPTNDIDIAAGSAAITGWLVAGGSIDYLGSAWDVSDGTRAIDLDGRDATFSSISQTFSTTPGAEYLVTFDLSGNPQGDSSLKAMRVIVEGVSQDYTFDTTGQTLDMLMWQSLSFSFIAQDATATLAFTSLSSSPSSFGALIDNVSVAPVPEPSTALLLATGVGIGLRGALRRSRR